MISEVDVELGAVKIEFLHPHGQRKTFTWPVGGDTCHVPMKTFYVQFRPHQLLLGVHTQFWMSIIRTQSLLLKNTIPIKDGFLREAYPGEGRLIFLVWISG